MQLTEIGRIGDHRLKLYHGTVGMQLVLTVKYITEKKKKQSLYRCIISEVYWIVMRV